MLESMQPGVFRKQRDMPTLVGGGCGFGTNHLQFTTTFVCASRLRLRIENSRTF